LAKLQNEAPQVLALYLPKEIATNGASYNGTLRGIKDMCEAQDRAGRIYAIICNDAAKTWNDSIIEPVVSKSYASSVNGCCLGVKDGHGTGIPVKTHLRVVSNTDRWHFPVGPCPTCRKKFTGVRYAHYRDCGRQPGGHSRLWEDCIFAVLRCLSHNCVPVQQRPCHVARQARGGGNQSSKRSFQSSSREQRSDVCAGSMLSTLPSLTARLC